MTLIPRIRIFIVIGTIIVLASIVAPVWAGCTSTPNGSGNNYVCTDITVETQGTAGNDTITNNGTISAFMWGGGNSANSSQQDTLINNGVVGSGEDDDGMWGSAGNDTIINNGIVHGGPWTIWNGVNGAVFGDDSLGVADHDNIQINNTVNGNVHGDYAAGGNDTITLNGQVNGGVYGEGPGSGGRAGNDTIILTNNAGVTTVIDGMGGNDRLRFDFSVPDEATYNALSSQISSANPASGSLTFNGKTFTWLNFEILENSIEWTGAPPNQPPTAVIAAPTAGQVFTANGTGNASVNLNAAGSSDSDGTIVSYLWSWTGAGTGSATGSSANHSFGIGSYTLTLTVTDDDGSLDSETRSFTVQPPAGQVTITLQPTSSADDVNEDGTSLSTNGALWIGNGSSASNSWLGVRFSGVNIPPGATINSAYLEVYSVANQWLRVNVNIRGEAADNSQLFTTTTKPSQRPLTTASATYNVDEQWTTNSWRNLGSVATIIQEIVNRPNWHTGNSLTLLLKGGSTPWGRKLIGSFDSNPAFAPRLVITFISNSTPPNQAPTAVIAAPTAGQVFTADGTGNASVNLSATGSTDSDGTISNYAWSWTGTASGNATGTSANQAFGVGSYTLTLTVTDDDGATDTETRSFTVQAAPNVPPTAVIASPTEAQVFTAGVSGTASVNLSATGSTDSDGTISSYAWSWTGAASGNATGASAIQAFGVGSYTLTLTVTDDDGATDTETRSFTVQAAPNVPPTAAISSPTEAQVFTAGVSGTASVNLSATGSSDSDGTITTYAWSWTGTTSGTTSGGATVQAFGVGSYTLTLTVTDDDGATGTATRNFSVQAPPNVPPTAVIASPTAGQVFTASGGTATVNLSATGSTDSDGTISTYAWSWTGTASGTATGASVNQAFGVGSYTLTLTVTDDDGATDTETVSFTIEAAPNVPPTAVITAPTEAQVFTADGTGNASVTLDATGSSDSDGTITSYAWSWTGTASGNAMGSSVNQAFGVGSYTLTLTVTDDDGATDTETVSFTVEAAPPVNQPPTAVITAPTEAQMFTAGGTGTANVTLNAAGSTDSDGSIVSYDWSWTGTTSGTTSGGATVQAFGVGSYNLTLTVTDDDGATDTETRSFTVQAAPNVPPTAAISSPTEAQVFTADGTGNASINLSATGSSDSDGTISTYAWSWTGTASGNAMGSSVNRSFGVGSYTLTLTVTDDDGATDTETRSFTVQATPNVPPTAVIASPTEAQVFTAGGTGTANVTLNAAGSADSDGSVVTYDWSWTGTTSGTTSGGATVQAFGVGSYTLTLTVTDDDGATDTETRSFTVQAAPNVPPTAAISSPTEAQVFTADGTGNASINLSATGSSDSDGTISSYAWSWTGAASGTVTGSSVNQSFGVGSYNLTLTVTDDDGATDTETRSFTVQAAPNVPPTAVIAAPTAGQVFTADGTGNASVNLSATGSSDSDGTISNYAWSWTGTASGTATGSSVNQAFGVGSYTLTLTVTDDDGATGTATRNFSVQAPVNQPPTISPISAQSTRQGVTISPLTVSASDPNNDPLTYSVTNLPTGLSFSTSTRQITGTVNANATVGARTVTVSVSDGVNPAVTLNFQWTVVDDLPPTFAPTNQTSTVGNVINLALASFASDPESLPLRFELTAGALPNGLTLQSTGQVTGTIGFGAATYTPTIRVIDSVGQSVSASFTWTVQAAPSGPVTLTVQPTAAADDVNEDGSSFTNSGSLWVGNASSATNSWMGVRFTGVNIPKGAIINSAQFEVFAVSTQWIALNMNIAGDAADNSAPFSTSNRPSQRALTTARLVHSSNQQWTQYNWYSLGSVANIVQEIVNRPNWQSGNSLSLVVKGTGAAWSRKSIASWDNNPVYAPRLVIQYTVNGQSMTGVAEIVMPETTAVTAVQEPTPVVNAPVAAFTSTPLVGEGPLTVQFTDTSTGADSYAWDFGDGTTSTEANPTKVYTTPGTYTVVLTVTNAGGTSTRQATVVVNAPPAPEVTVQPPPEEVQAPPTEAVVQDAPTADPPAEQTPEATG